MKDEGRHIREGREKGKVFGGFKSLLVGKWREAEFKAIVMAATAVDKKNEFSSPVQHVWILHI